jgi:hypothetical protein
MSLFTWLFPARKRPKAGADGSAPARMEAGRTGTRRTSSTPNSAQANRKNERMARRELLYAVVRQAMVRAGVLSASYKFKVLSLDSKGQQFLVMIDLARVEGADPARLAEIEALIAQGAKSRHNIFVTGVYWRTSEHVRAADGDAQTGEGGSRAQKPDDSRPAVLDSSPAPLDSGPGRLDPAGGQRTGRGYEPIQADEVAAFKSALAAGVSAPAAALASPNKAAVGARAFDGTGKHGPQSYTLLTGFEDTELPDAEGRTPLLSGTQYGELN